VVDDALNWNFTGWLASYKKDDPKALAIALSLSDKGTKSELLSHIDNYFKVHPNLQNNSRFSSIHNKVLGHQKTCENVSASMNLVMKGA
jgi:hypothetical protein